ncbi:hypothetical protein [Actinoplanes sp. NPDC049802]|uniref:hypothetical protein n=1 Tax=Actinoplanes sp. NPDC049802 TaxID=3154742 RepID=UPI0033FA0DF2
MERSPELAAAGLELIGLLSQFHGPVRIEFSGKGVVLEGSLVAADLVVYRGDLSAKCREFDAVVVGGGGVGDRRESDGFGDQAGILVTVGDCREDQIFEGVGA